MSRKSCRKIQSVDLKGFSPDVFRHLSVDKCASCRETARRPPCCARAAGRPLILQGSYPAGAPAGAWPKVQAPIFRSARGQERPRDPQWRCKQHRGGIDVGRSYRLQWIGRRLFESDDHFVWLAFVIRPDSNFVSRCRTGASRTVWPSTDSSEILWLGVLSVPSKAGTCPGSTWCILPSVNSVSPSAPIKHPTRMHVSVDMRRTVTFLVHRGTSISLSGSDTTIRLQCKLSSIDLSLNGHLPICGAVMWSAARAGLRVRRDSPPSRRPPLHRTK